MTPILCQARSTSDTQNTEILLQEMLVKLSQQNDLLQSVIENQNQIQIDVKTLRDNVNELLTRFIRSDSRNTQFVPFNSQLDVPTQHDASPLTDNDKKEIEKYLVRDDLDLNIDF
jgi:hypothetical protein